MRKKGNKSIRISFIKFIPAATKHKNLNLYKCFFNIRKLWYGMFEFDSDITAKGIT